jgi:hypothetical protein
MRAMITGMAFLNLDRKGTGDLRTVRKAAMMLIPTIVHRWPSILGHQSQPKYYAQWKRYLIAAETIDSWLSRTLDTYPEVIVS